MAENRILLAVKSCAADVSQGFNQVVRETWGKHVSGVTMRFFVGRGSIPLESDEIRLDVPDGYYALPQKTCAILQWAKYYHFIYLCDTDTFVRPELLMASGFEKYDVVGWFGPTRPGMVRHDGFWSWPSGGGGYWLSHKAATMIARHDAAKEWAEDRNVGQVLGPSIANGMLKALNRPDYGSDKPDLVTAHFCARGLHRDYDPAWMRELYAKFYQVTNEPGEIQQATGKV